jgi:hypothetical protein
MAKAAPTREVHFEHRPVVKKRSEFDPIVTVCKPTPWPGAVGSVLRSRLPRHVTCLDCLDWIANHHRLVVEQVNNIRSASP